MAGTGRKVSSGATAVVADDEVHVVDLIALLLESLGVRVVKVYDGEEALQATVAHRPRVLITDLLMPKLGGDELTRRIKAHPETADVKIVIVSSQPRESIVDIPADAFISKPFDLNHVEAVVLEYLADA